ncbi:hypothetical protein Tco_0139928 [Tanacetum coccineum]
MSSQAPTRHIDVTESLLSPAHGSSPLPDTEDPYTQVMQAYETDSTHHPSTTVLLHIEQHLFRSPQIYSHHPLLPMIHHTYLPPHQKVSRISDILPEEEPKEEPEEDPDEEPAPAENPTTDAPLGLGQRAAMLRQREFAADGIPSTFEIGQSSRAVQLHEPNVPNSPAAPAAPTPDVPTEAEDEDDDDDAIEQIRARLEMHASVIDLHNDQLDDLALSRIDEYERDVSRLNTRTGNMVRDLTTIKDRVYELQGDSMMARDAHQSIWQRLSTLEVQNVTLQRLHHEDCMEIQSLKRHVADLERAEKERRRQKWIPKESPTRNTRLQPAATTASVKLAAASTTDADTSRPIGNNNQGGTYKEFCSCMIGSFNETEGADAALTWWNNHLKSAGIYTTYAMPWEHFKEMVL